MGFLKKAVKGIGKVAKKVANVGEFAAGIIKSANIPFLSGVAGLAEKGLDVVGNVLQNTANQSTQSAKDVSALKSQVVEAVGTKAVNTSSSTTYKAPVQEKSMSSSGGLIDWFKNLFSSILAWYENLPVWAKWAIGGTVVLLTWWFFWGRKRKRGVSRRKRTSRPMSSPRRSGSRRKTTSKAAFVARMKAGRARAKRKRK